MHEIMQGYWTTLDASEKKRMKDTAKNRLAELLVGLSQHEAAKKRKEEEKEEQKIEQEGKVEAYAPWLEFVDATGINDPKAEIDPAAENVFNYLVKDILADQKKRLAERPAETVICPGVLTNLNISDQDNNSVFRIVVMKKFADDVSKAFRRSGVVAKPFDYNLQKFQDEKNELGILKERYENKLR